jgi:AraC-like DNA-binding protein
MELLTLGQKIHPGREVLLWHNPDETFMERPATNTRLRLILLEKGNGILRLGDQQRIAFNAPALLCLSEQETAVMEQGFNLQAVSLYFHPSVINSAFSFENIRGDVDDFKHTDLQDRFWLSPFVDHQGNQSGLLSLAPMTANRIARMIDSVARELSDQRDGFWPCRSRSHFLELLFLIHSLYREPHIAEVGVLSQVTSLEEIGQVILYLHAHYHEKINLNDLARHFHTNRTTLSRRFREITGQPVMTYLANLRVHLASLLLRNTTVPVTEVMHNVGFIDDTHFTRTFRKYTNTTPSRYRQQHCWLL